LRRAFNSFGSLEDKFPRLGAAPGLSARPLAHDGPVLIDAVVNHQQLVMPPAMTLEMAKGFTLFTLKAVLPARLRKSVRAAA
jgi:hypothetical protein